MVWTGVRVQPPGASPMVTLDLADLGDITAEPTDPAPSIARAELLTGLDADAVELLLAKPVEPLINVQIRHLGGALAEPGGGAGASGAYMFVALEQFRRHLKNREIYAQSSTRYRNPQAGLLDGAVWAAAKTDVGLARRARCAARLPCRHPG
ncbi:hypothetical protein ACGFNP_00085 [Nonomuraea sp. NPDC049269]|uniref:hypothetical protein n=1 Tax=Nonomuraea sp. NPDC049269 TaxID=3364349 RepID=UPI0037218AB1